MLYNPLFFPSVWEKYYTCNQEEIEFAKKYYNPYAIIFGIIYLVIGIIFLTLYIPCVIVMFKKEFQMISCYKIMLILGIIDVIALFVSCIGSGLLSIIGLTFCSCPEINIILGTIAVGLWVAACIQSLILAFSRIVDISHKKLFRLLFEGNRTYMWFILTLIYTMYFSIFSNPMIYSQISYAWFFDPFIDYASVDLFKRPTDYSNYPQVANNALFVILMTTAYSIMFYDLYKISKNNSHKGANKSLIKVQLQIFIVCFFVFSSALMYIYMQFFESPLYITIITQVELKDFKIHIFLKILWELSQGCASIVYIILNNTMKIALIKLLRCNTKNKVSVVFTKKLQKSVNINKTGKV
uniref:Serpentine Receptor, class T n=1 Tax=Parastrongyloides trichosuri TaxID=131310 RepID=A0A0N4Z5E3_PARTI